MYVRKAAPSVAGMFSGVSLFMPSANVCYIFCHFFGTIFVTLFCVLEWDLEVFPWQGTRHDY